MHGNIKKAEKYRMQLVANMVMDGATNTEISAKLNIPYHAAMQLVAKCKREGLARRRLDRAQHGDMADRQVNIWLAVETHEKLLTEAEARGCSIQVLCSRLMANIANDSMVNAVLEE